MDEILEDEELVGEDLEEIRELGWDVLAPGCYRKRPMRNY